MKSTVFTFCAFLLSSCFVHIVNDNYYSYLTPKEQSKIKHLEFFDEAQPGYIYKITGKQLMNELKNHEKSLVYTFKNGCTSDACLPFSQIRDYAKENDLKVFLIMNGYCNLNASLNQKVGLPFYSINAEAYNETKSRKYGRRFKKDIGYFEYLDKVNKKWLGNYYFYKKENITEIKKYLY
jgi:hypothetical protein